MILMDKNTYLIETSFTDAIAILANAHELPAQTRRHWGTSLRQIAKALDRPLAVIPARYSAIRADLSKLHQVPVGLTAKTLQNHKSNAKSALLWLAREKGIPQHGAPLSAEWETLRQGIRDGLVRQRLSSLMRFCSANDIAPNCVDERVVERFLDYRCRTGKSHDAAFRRLLARAWNGNIPTIPHLPTQQLRVPPIKPGVKIDWAEFPEGLRLDIERYLDGLAKVRRSRTGQRIRPLQPSTIATRRAELKAVARTAVKAGIAVDSLCSLAALLHPDVAEKVLDAYWQRNGKEPKNFTIDLSCRFVAIARQTGCLDEPSCARLDDLRRSLEDH